MQLTFGIDNLEKAASAFIEKIGDDTIFLFDAEMGAGKTTFIAEVCRQLGATDDFGSPTFSLVNEYADKDGHPIYHFDLYRVESPAEVADMGAEEYFYSGNLCLVEWPDRLGILTPPHVRKVEIKVNDDDTRTISF